MRKIAHRLLTGAPALTLAFLSLWGTAYPERAKRLFANFTSMIEATGLWPWCALIVVYFSLWWWTSLETKSPHDKLKARLRIFHTRVASHRGTMIDAENDTDFEQAQRLYMADVQAIADWVSDNLGLMARQKFAQPRLAAGGYFWPSNAGSTLAEARSTALIYADARLTAIQDFIRDETFYEGGITRRERLRRWWKQRRSRSTME